jgi:hypothetical protein
MGNPGKAHHQERSHLDGNRRPGANLDLGEFRFRAAVSSAAITLHCRFAKAILNASGPSGRGDFRRLLALRASQAAGGRIPHLVAASAVGWPVLAPGRWPAGAALRGLPR